MQPRLHRLLLGVLMDENRNGSDGRMGARTGLGALALLLLAFGGLYWYRRYRPVELDVVLFFRLNPEVRAIYESFKAELDRRAAAAGRRIQYAEHDAGASEREAAAIAQALRNRRPRAVAVVGYRSAQALKKAGVGYPVVFAGVADPVGAGLVERLSGHGENFTGTRFLVPVRAAHDVLLQAYPNARRIGCLAQKGEPRSLAQLEALHLAAAMRGISVVEALVSGPADLEAGVQDLIAMGIEAVYVPPTELFFWRLGRVAAPLRASGIPFFSCNAHALREGALFSVSPDYQALGARTAEIAARILLGGEPPQDIDVAEVEASVLHVNASHPDSRRVRPIPGLRLEAAPAAP